MLELQSIVRWKNKAFHLHCEIKDDGQAKTQKKTYPDI